MASDPDSSTSQGISDQSSKPDPSCYFPLYKAALRGNWKAAQAFLRQNPEAIRANIAAYPETVLHVAAAMGTGADFVNNLMEMMQPEDLTLTDVNADTPLHLAALVGDVKVAKILVQKNPSLPYIKNKFGTYPLQKAAMNAQRDVIIYLLSVTKDNLETNPYAGTSGVDLLVNVIDSGFLDVALYLAQRYPHMAQLKLDDGRCALLQIARKASAFRSGCHLNFIQRFFYKRINVTLENNINGFEGGDEGGAQGNNSKSHPLIWRVIRFLAPFIANIEDKKVMHCQAVELVKCLCENILCLNDAKTFASLDHSPIVEAARLDIPEVIEEIVTAFPSAIWSYNMDMQAFFHVAVIHRNEKVFNLFYQMSDHKWRLAQMFDKDGNNILHLAGKLAPLHKLNLVAGPALQMQREIQWFKEVEKCVRPQYLVMENKAGETPAMVFTREHKDLAKRGEWMKGTAESCTIAAALIVTIVFAAAITVPGGNNQDSGIPIFSRNVAFVIFSVSDAISLFTSVTSLLMFLSILTSRYAEKDFLDVLPKRLIIGLVTLFLSITSMMITFSSTAYLVLGREKAWTLIPVGGLACLPITLFVSLQFPLLRDVIFSTFGSGNFGRQSNRLFH